MYDTTNPAGQIVNPISPARTLQDQIERHREFAPKQDEQCNEQGETCLVKED